jgi:hypothetical protein
MTLQSANGFSTTYLYVVTPYGPFGTIQSAIDQVVADGYASMTILINPGTYTENLTLYSQINLLGGGSDGEVIIVGSHTPPATGTIMFNNIKFQSASSVITDAAAGTCNIKFYDCLFLPTNYVCDLTLWTGDITIESCGEISGGSNGIIFNNGAAPVIIEDSSIGSGTSALTLSGVTRISNSRISCPINTLAASTVVIQDSTINGLITSSVTSSVSIYNTYLDNIANPVLSTTSANPIILSNVTINTSHGTPIGGTGAIELGEVVFLDGSGIAGGITKTITNQCDVSNSNIHGVIRLPASNAAATEGCIYIDSDHFMHALGTDNLFLGSEAGNISLNTTLAIENTGIGSHSLHDLTSGAENSAIGEYSLESCTTSSFNTACGRHSLMALTTAATDGKNTAIGCDAGLLMTTGERNTILGADSLSVTTGSTNISIGYNSGSALVLAESDNIIIGNIGTVGDTNTIRIGTDGSGSGQQDANYQAGIYQATSGATKEVVYIDSNHKLSSSTLGVVQWETATADMNLVNDHGYITKIAIPGLLTYTLPTTSAVGSIIEIVGYSAGGWLIAQGAGQSIGMGANTSTTGVGGSVASFLASDSLRMLCVTADTEWEILSAIGNLTIV